MGGVLHETFVSFITFEVYMFKDSNLLCLKEESLRQPHLEDFLPFLIASSMVEKVLVSARSCHFAGVYTRQVWKSRSVQFLRHSGVTQTHRQTFFQIIYKPSQRGRVN